MSTFNSKEENCPQSYNRRPNKLVHRRADYTFISRKAYEHVHGIPSPDCNCLMPRCMSSLSSLAVAMGWQPSLAHVFLLLHAHGRHCLRHLWSRDSMSSTGSDGGNKTPRQNPSRISLYFVLPVTWQAGPACHYFSMTIHNEVHQYYRASNNIKWKGVVCANMPDFTNNGRRTAKSRQAVTWPKGLAILEPANQHWNWWHSHSDTPRGTRKCFYFPFPFIVCFKSEIIWTGIAKSEPLSIGSLAYSACDLDGEVGEDTAWSRGLFATLPVLPYINKPREGRQALNHLWGLGIPSSSA